MFAVISRRHNAEASGILHQLKSLENYRDLSISASKHVVTLASSACIILTHQRVTETYRPYLPIESRPRWRRRQNVTGQQFVAVASVDESYQRLYRLLLLFFHYFFIVFFFKFIHLFGYPSRKCVIKSVFSATMTRC